MNYAEFKNKIANNETFAICISGLSGSGKTYMANQMIKEIFSNDFFVINISATNNFEHGDYEDIFHGIIDSIDNDYLNDRVLTEILKQYISLIPKLGRMLSEIVDISENSELQKIINTELKQYINDPSYYILDFINELSRNKKILLFFDDIQRLDNKSFDLYISFIRKLEKLNLYIISTNNYRYLPSQSEKRTVTIDEINTRCSYVFSIQSNKFEQNDIISILQEKYKLLFSIEDENIRLLYEYSNGNYHELLNIITLLLERKMLIRDSARCYNLALWDKNQIEPILADVNVKLVKQVYKFIDNSRKILEVASVFGEKFSAEAVHQTCQQECEHILKQIESSNMLVMNEMRNRLWKFNHTLSHLAVYSYAGEEIKKLHRDVAIYLEKNTKDFSAMANHYYLAGELENKIRCKLREIDKIFHDSSFDQVCRMCDNLEIELRQDNIHNPDFKNDINIYRAKSLYFLHDFKSSLGILQKINKTILDEEKEADVNRWLGRVYSKFSTPKDFELSIECLKKAEAYYDRQSENDSKYNHQIAEILTDMLVPYAHLNNFEETRRLFDKTAKLINCKDYPVAYAKLLRRCVIFFEEESAASHLEYCVDIFTSHGIIYETINALTNASTMYIYLDDFGKANYCLSKAIQASEKINNYGISFIYNNLALINILSHKYDDAKKNISKAKEGPKREVVELVVANNEIILDILSSGINENINKLEQHYERTKRTNENAYLYPAIINYATVLIEIGKIELALEKLFSLKDYIDNAIKLNLYDFTHWFSLVEKCLSSLDDDRFKLNEFISKLNYVSGKKKSKINILPYKLIDLQFWSD